MSPIQQMLLGVGAVATKTYVDDIFSTYLWKGDGTSGRTITNNIDVSSEGGMVWVKNRTNGGTGYEAIIADTLRGNSRKLYPSESNAQSIDTTGVTGFTTSGFTVGDSTRTNYNNHNFASWTFRKSSGFFTCLTYVGSGSAQSISHDLGSVPGMIIIKNYESDDPWNWRVYHRSTGATKFLQLNSDNDAGNDPSGAIFNSTEPTASVFSVGTDETVNKNGDKYVAYLFAGGESTQNEAVSVDFDGTGDYLSLAATSDFAFGTGAYTVEFWVKPDTISENKTFFNVASSGGFAVVISSSKVAINGYSVGDKLATSTGPVLGQWTHYALVREGTGSNQTKIYKNGVLEKTGTDSTDWTTTATTGLGANASNGNKAWDGEISNFRVVKGTAVYTSSFKPSTEPLTNITNTKLLCCNDSSTTGSSVTPGTITANGNPTASTDSPFDDPAAFTFGESGSENVVKTGSYVGSGSAGLEVNLGWEPQWVLIKDSTSSNDWKLFDSMRGVVSGGSDNGFQVQTSNAEFSGNDRIDFTPTGFKITTNATGYNSDGNNHIFMCLRRPDGYVGKPPELGTDVFAMDMSSASASIPTFDSTFPVDFALKRKTASTDHWLAGYRLLGQYSLSPDRTNTETDSGAGLCWDSNLGFGKTFGTANQGWMWKRHAGMDVVTYKGNDGTPIAHSLGKTPEMIWVKNRDNTDNWNVWHKGLNGGGSNAANYYLRLNTTDSEQTATNRFGGSGSLLPTSTHIFSSGVDSYQTNSIYYNYIAMLFASVDGISKVGSYSGQSSDLTVECGFAPRFLIVKAYNQAYSWLQVDTTRGWASGNNSKYLFLELNWAESAIDVGYPTSNGFVAKGGSANINDAGVSYIYYAHA